MLEGTFFSLGEAHISSNLRERHILTGADPVGVGVGVGVDDGIRVDVTFSCLHNIL